MNISLVIHYFINKENHNEPGTGTSEVGRTDKKLADMEGRRPRLYMAEMEEDHSKEERKLAATTFADGGWDVDVGSMEPRKTPHAMP